MYDAARFPPFPEVLATFVSQIGVAAWSAANKRGQDSSSQATGRNGPGSGEVVSRFIMGIIWVTMWVLGAIDLLCKSSIPDHPSTLPEPQLQRIQHGT